MILASQASKADYPLPLMRDKLKMIGGHADPDCLAVGRHCNAAATAGSVYFILKWKTYNILIIFNFK